MAPAPSRIDRCAVPYFNCRRRPRRGPTTMCVGVDPLACNSATRPTKLPYGQPPTPPAVLSRPALGAVAGSTGAACATNSAFGLLHQGTVHALHQLICDANLAVQLVTLPDQLTDLAGEDGHLRTAEGQPRGSLLLPDHSPGGGEELTTRQRRPLSGCAADTGRRCRVVSSSPPPGEWSSPRPQRSPRLTLSCPR